MASYIEPDENTEWLLNNAATVVPLVPTNGAAHYVTKTKPIANPKKELSEKLSWQTLDAVEMRSVEFADKPLLLKDAFHLVTGRKAQGKGTVLAEIASRVTRGELGEKRSVVWIGSEDSAAVDLKPRIVAAGGDPNKMIVIRDGWLQLPRDLEEIATKVAELGDVGMLVVDPIGNHLFGRDSNSEGDVRDAIAPLNQLADKYELMIFGVRHLSEKECRAGALSAVLGSSAWIQVPRAVLAIVRDTEDPTISHIQCVAGNRLPPETPGRMFRIQGTKVEGLNEEVTRAVWIGDSVKDVESMLSSPANRQSSKTAKARQLILDTLDAAIGGEMESDALDALVMGETGLESQSVRNLRSDLNKKDGLIGSRQSWDQESGKNRWMVYRTLAPRATQIPA